MEFAQELAGIRDGTFHAKDGCAIELAFGEERRRRVFGHGNDHGHPGARAIRGERAGCVAGRRSAQRAGTQVTCHRNRHGHAARLE